jgi:tetratricopeptide (TPR) repeat protein
MKRSVFFAAALVFLLCFAAYVSTLNSTFRADDSPETIAASVTLGIQHPPAYPLQTLIGRIFSLLPLGSPAFRVNLMAAFFGALTCALLTLGLSTWLWRPDAEGGQNAASLSASALAGLVLGLSKTFWSQCLAAKGGIYTLHSACMAGLFLGLVLWARDMQTEGPAPVTARNLLASRWARLAVLLFALSFGNHWETQALIAPATGAFALFLLWGARPWPFWRQPAAQVQSAPLKRGGERAAVAATRAPWPWQLWAWPALFIVLGLSIYVYLPLRAQHSPFMNWGDPRDWNQFWWVFQRQEYLDLEVGFLKSVRAALLGQGSWGLVSENWVFVQRQGLRVLGHLFGPQADLGWPCALLSLLGAWALGRECQRSGALGWGPLRSRPLAAWCLVLAGAFSFVITFYFHLKTELVWILDVFLIPVYLVQATLAGLGAVALWQTQVSPAFLVSKVGRVALVLLPLGLGGGLYSLRADAVSQVRHFVAYDFGHDLLLCAKRNAVILAEGDFNTMPIYYLQQVAHERPDVDHVTTVFLSTDWGVAHARRVQPRLGIGEVPKTITGARAGDGQVLRAALGQVAVQAQAHGRPFQCAWFHEVLAANVHEWEGGWRPSGLLTELNGPLTPEEDRRRLGLMKALRTRHLELDRDHLEPSPEFALSNYGTAYLELANHLRQRGFYAQALPLYARAALVSSKSNLAEILTHHGIALASGGAQGQPRPDLQGAAVLFRRSIEVKPLFEAYVNLAGVCNQLAQATKQVSYYAEAEASATRATQLAPTNAQAWNNLAIAQYYQNRRGEAVETLRRALQLAPGDPQIIANLKALAG